MWTHHPLSKRFCTRITQGCIFFSGPDRSRNKFSRSEQSRLCFVVLTFAFLKQSWLQPTTCYSILINVVCVCAGVRACVRAYVCMYVCVYIYIYIYIYIYNGFSIKSKISCKVHVLGTIQPSQCRVCVRTCRRRW